MRFLEAKFRKSSLPFHKDVYNDYLLVCSRCDKRDFFPELSIKSKPFIGIQQDPLGEKGCQLGVGE